VTQRRQVAAAAAAAAGGVRLAAPRRQSSRRLGVAFIIPGRRLRISASRPSLYRLVVRPIMRRSTAVSTTESRALHGLGVFAV